MRRFACHYLYVSADGCYSKYVVELEDSGRVRAYFPLKEEISATQWIGGVIIISPMYELGDLFGESFVDFSALRHAGNRTWACICMAYS